ncbi:MAG: hypothetical protein Q8P35_03375 [Candidatus Yanofskybacteria bacterium]|nr:hypothetical protein [Candidatus Yanofskybacteria bacterium]
MEIEKRQLLVRVGLWVILAALLAGAIFMVMRDEGPKDDALITSFQECADAGHPVLDTFPRICKLPSGETFVEEVVIRTCQEDSDCSEGLSCQGGICTDFAVEISCQLDSDCEIINRSLKFACCWAGACDVVDYSEPKWVAVNAKWYSDQKATACPSARECGPVPLCRDAKAVVVGEESYEAQCIANACQKVPRGK